ncbi:MAG: SGNH/GDSL hydrolase family protein [Clostridia bacterium]|nr:SGNH/GDSL hydrolase family protein [Clostridia bacterium]
MGYGPFHAVRNLITASYEGNKEAYSFKNIEQIDSVLKGKQICVLGSSVVYGYASQECSIPEYFSARFGCSFTKEAVSGTTLVDAGALSYVSRLKKLDKNEHYDLFICQLSTNDASKEKPLGEISTTGNYDTATVTGAIEYIIKYARITWNCPVVFFTGSHYDSAAYDAMVKRLYEIKEKYDIGILDLWNDKTFNQIPDDLRALYMHDDIHPTKAGYRDWWGPELEKQLLAILSAE